MLHPFSSPQMLGRPSSPLNPYASSSSPLTSPTQPYSIKAQAQTHFPLFALPLPMHASGSSSPTPSPFATLRSRPGYTATATNTRYQKPAKRESGNPLDLFVEGTTPTEGAMWRERFGRRIAERERRKKAREEDLNRRRNLPGSSVSPIGIGGEEEAERQAQADDEEIFRRLMVLQRKREYHATLVSHERELGSSPSPLPDSEFWDQDQDLTVLEQEEEDLIAQLEEEERDRFQTPLPRRRADRQRAFWQDFRAVEQEDDWAREAAEAEAAEQVELEHRHQHQHQHQRHGHLPELAPGDMDVDVDGGVDWEAFDSMDIE